MARTSRRSSSPMTPMLHKPISFGNFRQRLPGGRRGSSSSGVRFPKVMAVGRKEGNVLFNDALNTFFIYGYMASDIIWLRTILIVRKETRCRHIGYSFRLAAKVLLYAPSHRQDSTYHGLYYTSRGALAGTRNWLWEVIGTL